VADDALRCIDFLPPRRALRHPGTPLAREVVRQLRAYLADAHHRFDVPLAAEGSLYQGRVWRALRRIPSGHVWTYGRLAQYLGSGPRAVGGACGANPIPVVIPCHRVVAAGGIGGYTGSVGDTPLAIKRWLLAHEGAHV